MVFEGPKQAITVNIIRIFEPDFHWILGHLSDFL